ncbi:unnamed protein product [Spirodela intermedia]|uniref:Uncharacterized protein n=1 Tax=Spirodela intermedia TaxID=51605 RepID=A0ABN7E848_SPIIN|nr:unnamed protein product [Spirodela intermedia]
MFSVLIPLFWSFSRNRKLTICAYHGDG